MKFIVRTIQDIGAAVESYQSRLDGDKAHILIIKPVVKARTEDQNSLYWAWLTCIGDETGSDKNYLHEYFKKRYLDHENIEVFQGESFADNISVKVSTAKLNVSQFRHYLNKVKVFAATELNITLPEKEDPCYAQFYEYYANLI